MKNKGFTLIELLVAISIMGVIVLMALPAVRRVQLDNKDKKYVAYEKALKAASKLFVDGYDEDLFGYVNSGCSTVTYEELVEKDLIEPIQIDGVTCSNVDSAHPKTFLYVMKDRKKNHHYFMNIECRDGEGNIVYKNNEDAGRDSCGLEDGNGPTVTVINENPITEDDYIDNPYNNGKAGNNKNYPETWVVVEDKNVSTGYQAVGLRPEHQKLYYSWYKTTKNGTTTIVNREPITIHVKDYYASTGKGSIPVPTDDMAIEEQDARYSLRVFGTVEDMDGNKSTNESDGWRPTDYPDSRYEGYEVEKQSKCPTIKWKQANNSDAVKTDWYNNTRNQIRIEIQPIDSVISRFKANHYVVKAEYKNEGFQDINTNLPANQLQKINVVTGINGKYKYNVSYYKTEGTSGKNYTCPNTDAYQFDHDNPSVVSFTVGKPGDPGTTNSHIDKYKNISGYEKKATLKGSCSDPTSPVVAVYNGTKQSSSSFSKEETSHGSQTKKMKCVDAAGNESSESSKTFYVMYYANESGTYCGSYTDTCTGTRWVGAWQYDTKHGMDSCPSCPSGWEKVGGCNRCPFDEDLSNGGSRCKQQECRKWNSEDHQESYTYSCTKYYSCWY